MISLIIWTIWSVLLLGKSEGSLRLCQGSKGKAKYDNVALCSAGVILVDHPRKLILSRQLEGKGSFCYVEDVCKSSRLQCKYPKDGVVKAQYIEGNVTINGHLHVFDENEPQACNIEEVNEIKTRRKRATAIGETRYLGRRIASQELIDETHQMFLYLAGLDTTEASLNIESSKLLQDVLNVMHRRCDPTRMDPLFLRSVYKAFLWLLSKYHTSELEDIPTEIATKARKALAKCAFNPHAIHLSGSDCLAKITYVSLQVGDNGMEAAADYHPDEKFSFKWGQYDPIVDAIWLSIDGVHTLCSKYLENAGVLHEFSTYMTKLLTLPRMKERWRTPTPLRRHEIYDHLLLAPVNQSLAILDACNFAGTIASPFGRSVRPYNAPPGARKRRSTGKKKKTHVVCLSSESQRQSVVRDIRKSHCSNRHN